MTTRCPAGHDLYLPMLCTPGCWRPVRRRSLNKPI